MNTLYWTEDRSDAFCTNMAEHAGVKEGDVIAFGHTHLPYHKQVAGVHLVNTGSVGRPKDGDWRAGYVVLGLGDGDPSVDFIRVEYDVKEAADAIRASELPTDFAEYLETGGKPLARR
jgi:diadenosine tetraphosphatase ApaH/serine/threonine PP2A family protein phosphatase